ncbi:hypothetical protein BDV09DRAFT_190857 [Aspergillus tetrazonus]
MPNTLQLFAAALSLAPCLALPNQAGNHLCTGIEGYTTPTTTTIAAPTTTTPSNGVTTPSPIQPGIITDCASFHEVQSGDTCALIAKDVGISLSQFNAWNTGVGSGCSSLWLGYYVCVSKIRVTTTTTKPGNGVATPSPIQPGMTGSCKKFHKVVSGDQCGTIAKKAGISLANFNKWNPGVGSNCKSLWLGYNVCVGV